VKKSTRKPGRQRDWERALLGDSILLVDFWRNTLNPNSLRLTPEGWKFCNLQKKPFYQFKLESMTNLQLLQLDHLLESPYYIRNRTQIELMGEKDAMMLSLHGNDLKKYLDNLDSNKD
jgi:hypothetical protein